MNHPMILFLDFDGVLHPEGASAEREFSHLGGLESVLREFPHVLIVVSSAWRLDTSLDAIRSRFSDDMRTRVVGVTPQLAELEDQRGQRQRECELWLQHAYPAATSPPWIALDDRESYFDAGCQNLILVPRNHLGGMGLSADCLERLRHRLMTEEKPTRVTSEQPSHQ